MIEKEFKKHLMLYGAVIEDWPEEIQADAIRAASQPSINALLIEQRYFEELLRDNDAIEPVNLWLSDRIINAAGQRKASIGVSTWLQELLAYVLPQPAFAFATVVALGIVIGFSLHAPSGEDNVAQNYTEDATL